MEENVPREKYRIKVESDITKIRHTLNYLFKYGYVFSEDKRYKTFSQIRSAFRNRDMEDWNYIVTGIDDECKMVIGFLPIWAWSSDVRSYTLITIEDFLVKMGHVNPCDFPPKVGDWPMDKAVEMFRQINQQYITVNKSRAARMIFDVYSKYSDEHSDECYDMMHWYNSAA